MIGLSDSCAIHQHSVRIIVKTKVRGCARFDPLVYTSSVNNPRGRQEARVRPEKTTKKRQKFERKPIACAAILLTHARCCCIYRRLVTLHRPWTILSYVVFYLNGQYVTVLSRGGFLSFARSIDTLSKPDLSFPLPYQYVTLTLSDDSNTTMGMP